MTLRALRLLRFELTVTDLERSAAFYTDALGFSRSATSTVAFAPGRQILLHRDGQSLALQQFETAGAPYPAASTACDQVFQHFALPVTDIAAAYARLAPFAATPISHAGPQRLPASSGGATAYKFRDPDGHPLELIQFQDGHAGGIDHSAIASLDVERSIRFYRDQLGFGVQARQVNTGPEQDRLDGLAGVSVDVVALTPEQATPHVELLAYRTPPGQAMPRLQPQDVAATRLVLEVTGLTEPELVRDPDGHLLVLVNSPSP